MKGNKLQAGDPMPTRIEPCLATLVTKPPAGNAWSYEIKWDGYRLAVHRESRIVRVLTRGGHNWTERFPAIAEAVRKLEHQRLIIDGEAVVLDELGRSDFGALQQALGGRGGRRKADEAILFCFDLLYLDGDDLRTVPLSDRRKLLLNVIATDRSGVIRMSEDIEHDGGKILDHACAMGLEGIIAKRVNSSYRSGRHSDWFKIKCVQRDSFAIIGYEPSSSMSGSIARLMLAARRDTKLVYVGVVGTGFSHLQARELKNALDAIPSNKIPFPMKRKHAVFSEPIYIAEIAYRGWTREGKLRHASFKGLRQPEDEATIFDLNALP